MDDLKRELNEYLFLEFGIDGDESHITDSWPFVLTLLAAEPGFIVFEFNDDQRYFALAHDALNFMPQAGMGLEDLRLQHAGSFWIASRNPINLETVQIGDDSVPPTFERRQKLEALGVVTVPADGLEILEGLYLRSEARYLGLFRRREAKQAFVAGLADAPIYVGFPDASRWRRLAWGVGFWLQLQKRM